MFAAGVPNLAMVEGVDGEKVYMTFTCLIGFFKENLDMYIELLLAYSFACYQIVRLMRNQRQSVYYCAIIWD